MFVGFKLLLAVGKGTLPLLSRHTHVAKLLIRLKICVSVGSLCSALISNNLLCNVLCNLCVPGLRNLALLEENSVSVTVTKSVLGVFPSLTCPALALFEPFLSWSSWAS